MTLAQLLHIDGIRCPRCRRILIGGWRRFIHSLLCGGLR